MSRLLIRVKSQGWITFIHTESEFKEFMDNYLPGRHLIIGDVATFTSKMKSMLLKVIEENPALDVYSSVDIQDSTLLSRFVTIGKEPLKLPTNHDVDKFIDSDRSYVSAISNLDKLKPHMQLIAPLLSKPALKYLCNE